MQKLLDVRGATSHRVALDRHSIAERTIITAALGGVIAAAACLPAAAAPGLTSTGVTTANVVVTSAISLTGLTNNFTLTGVPGATVTGLAAVTFRVETNNRAGYTVTVQAAAARLSPATNGNPDNIPIADLSVRETGTTTFTPLSNTTPVTVHTQATRSVSGGDALSNDYRVAIPFVNEDTYSVNLDYVATTL